MTKIEAAGFKKDEKKIMEIYKKSPNLSLDIILKALSGNSVESIILDLGVNNDIAEFHKST